MVRAGKWNAAGVRVKKPAFGRHEGRRVHFPRPKFPHSRTHPRPPVIPLQWAGRGGGGRPETTLDPRAQEYLSLVRPLWQGLHAAARQYAGSGADAEDLVQEALTRGWRSFSPTDASTYTKAWLFVILRNVAFEWRRLSKRRVRLVPLMDADLTDPEGEHPSPGEDADFAPFAPMDEARFTSLVDERIIHALERLDDPMREVLMLSVAGGLSYRDIAAVLRCPVGTVMSRMARARRRLRDELADHARAAGWTRGGGVCP